MANIDGILCGVYCHWDGYPKGVGATLLKYYNSKAKIKELLLRGDMSSLGDTIASTKFYQKDYNKLKETTFDFIILHQNDCEYVYYFNDWNEWEVIRNRRLVENYISKDF